MKFAAGFVCALALLALAYFVIVPWLSAVLLSMR